jgi:hypothetical protein
MYFQIAKVFAVGGGGGNEGTRNKMLDMRR